jgi:hypothetical protein
MVPAPTTPMVVEGIFAMKGIWEEDEKAALSGP